MAERRVLPRILPYALLGLAIGFGLFYWLWCRRSPTTYLIVRHADRLGQEDALTAAGVARARELAHVCEKAGIAGIYHTEMERSRLTAAPAAAALGIAPVVIPTNQIAALVDHIEAHHHGQAVLVVAHGDTVPMIVHAAGGPAIPDIPRPEYDDLFVLTRCRCPWRTAKLVNLQYGERSPPP